MYHYPQYAPGDFARWHDTKIKVLALRFDPEHMEFQYLISIQVNEPYMWVSEKTVD